MDSTHVLLFIFVEHSDGVFKKVIENMNGTERTLGLELKIFLVNSHESEGDHQCI